MKFKEYNQEQPWLIPPNLEDEIPKNDLCRVINDLVDIIDIDCITNKYKEEGNPGFHPRMMIKTLYYSYSQSIFSSRKISLELERNIFYWYLSGKQRPDFRTICLFRKRHLKELKDIFKEITRICIKLGLVGFKTVAIDGTKIKANASKDKFRDKDWIDKKISEDDRVIEEALSESERIDKEEDKKYGVDKRGDEIPEDIIDRKKRLEKIKKIREELKEKDLNRVNETDTDSRIMKSHGKFIPAYNCQAVVDEKQQVIVVAEVTSEENDFYQIKPNMDDFQETYSRKPELLLADTGYCDGESLKYLKEENIEGLIPDKQPKNIKAEMDDSILEKKKYKKDQFKYDKKKDVYICPEGNKLIRVTKKHAIAKRKKGKDLKHHIYQCINSYKCKHSGNCCRSKADRRILRYEDEELREEMAAKIRTKDCWEKYKSRMKIVEPVFGNIKQNLRFNSFNLRGIAKTRGEFLIIAAVHNIIKIKKYLEKNKIKNLKLALNSV